MDALARAPDSDSDWQAIDIFVFSNGQQYSPPRKYHLQTEDINLWKSTLGFLAKTQYGPFHSMIDLYTIEGRKIADPLQLTNGGSYVAVQPPDRFIEAGYDKYLIKASRSWEKRKAKRNESAAEANDPKYLPKVENISENVECENDKQIDEELILKSRASSTANHDASTIIKPQLLSAPQRKSDLVFATKQSEKKKASIQSPLLVRKFTPSLIPASSLKDSFSKKKDSIIKSADRISKLENRRRLSCPSDSYDANKLLPRLSKSIKPPFKSRDSSIRSEAILPKVLEPGKKQKTSSIKITSPNKDVKLLTNNVDLKNIVEDKELILVSNLHQTPNRDLPSVSVNTISKNSCRDNPSNSFNPIPMQSILYEPVRQQANTTITDSSNSNIEETVHHISSDVKISVVENNENTNIPKIIESVTITHNETKNNIREKFSNENLLIEQYSNHTTQDLQENLNLLNNEREINVPKTKNNIKNVDSSPKRCSIKLELTDNQNKLNYHFNKLEENFNDEIIVNAYKCSEPIKVSNSSPPRSPSINKSELDRQYIAQQIEGTQALPPTVIEKSLNDHYITTLKKGDVVNLKLNIEIENRVGNLIKHSEDLNCQSVTVIQTDKGSQNNIDDQIIAQSKSLLSMLSKDCKGHNVADNHRVIVVQYNCCKYCNYYNATNADKDDNKNYLILLPLEKFEEINERCHCNESGPEIVVSSLINPVKTTYSCTSLEAVSKPLELPTDLGTPNICTTLDSKSTENLVMVTRKKSVAINEDISPCARIPSKSIQQIDVETKLIKVSVESIGTTTPVIVLESSSTQTEWCDVLLEARLLCDGHYAFCLPPLELLKFYKLT